MISRQNSRKSVSTSSRGGTLRQRMQGDPFVRKKTVRYVAIIDLGISGLLLFYAGYRLVNYNFNDQSLILLIGAKDNIFLAMVYWLGVFTLIGLQLVIAFLLLTATKDMTTDPETMIKKCQLWKTFSIVLLAFLMLDLFISTYTYFVLESEKQRLVSLSIDAGEGLFRLFGVFVVGKFITDLHLIFANPMTTSASSSPVLPHRTVSRTSSITFTVHDLMTLPPTSTACSRTQSMNAAGDSVPSPVPLSRTMTVPVPRSGNRTPSVCVDFMPKFSRTPLLEEPPPPSRSPRPPLSRTTSIVGSETSGSCVGRGSRNSGGALILDIDDGFSS